jgi:coatomer subunit beta
MRFSELPNTAGLSNSFRAEAMLTMSSIIRVGQSQFVKTRIDEDSVDRIMSCFRALAEFKQLKDIEDVFLTETKTAYTTMLAAEDKTKRDKALEERNKSAIQVDDVIIIRQLIKKGGDKTIQESELDLSKATKGGQAEVDDSPSKLSRIVQLTGFSDPVYAEAFVKVNKFDIILDVLLVNQTTETLQNLSLEFATLGDLKLVERPTTQNVAAHSFLSLQATVKVSSADTGVIFGSIVYDRPGSVEQEIVILNDVHVDVMDYIQPATCTENQFRSMWTEFEWENKVNVNSKGQDQKLTLREYLDRLMKRTNMACLTPEASLRGDCSFLSANLYAKSVFGMLYTEFADYRRGCTC